MIGSCDVARARAPALFAAHLLPAPRSADARQAALEATGLLDAAPSATLERLTRLVRRVLGVPLAMVTLADRERLYYAAAAGMDGPYPELRESPLGESFCQQVVESAATMQVSDARNNPALCTKPGVLSGTAVAYLGVPLMTPDGHVLGSFCAIDNQSRDWSAEDLATMQDLAGAVMAEINARAAANSQQVMSEHYSDLLDTTTELVCSLDERGLVTYVNKAWCATLGYEPHEAIGMPALQVVLPTEAAHYREISKALRANGVIEHVELTMITRSGRKVIGHGRATAVRSTDGENRILSSHAVYRDVTIERRAEQESRVLLQVTQALAQTRDMTSAMTTALRILGSEAGWEFAEAWLPVDVGSWTPEEAKTRRLQLGPVWYVPGDARLVWFREQSSKITFGMGEGLPGQVAASKAPLYVPDLANAQFISRLDAARASGLHAAHGVPILIDGAVFAVLSFFSRDTAVREPSAQRLVEAVAAQVGTVLQRALAEAALERERTFLSTVLDSLSDNVSVCSANGRLVLFNRATRETHGLPESGEIPSSDWARSYSVFEPDGVTPFKTENLPLVRVLNERRDVSGVEFVVSVPGRTPRTLVANAHVLRGPGGELDGAVCTSRDMTAQKSAELALRESERRLSLIFNKVTDLLMFARVERDGSDEVTAFRVLSVNDPLANAGFRTREEYVGHTLDEIATPANLEMVRAHWNTVARSGEPVHFESRSVTRNGRVLFAETSITPVLDAEGRCTHLLSSSRDVTASREADAARRESEGAFRKMLETIRAIAMILDADGRVLFANDSLLSLTGWSREEAIGSDWFERFVPEAAAMRRLFDGVMSGADMIPHNENELRTRTGRKRLVVWDNTTLYNAKGDIVGMASIGHDVTEQRQMEKRLAELSERDELTGLLNRRGFMQQVEFAMKSGMRSARRDALLFIDLDKFKPINDTFGHGEGDNALRAVATLLRATMRDSDVAGRLGGDEFAIYAVDAKDADGGASLVERLQAALAAHNRHATESGRPYEIGFSIGKATVVAGDTREALLARADEALYAIKRLRPRLG